MTVGYSVDKMVVDSVALWVGSKAVSMVDLRVVDSVERLVDVKAVDWVAW